MKTRSLFASQIAKASLFAAVAAHPARATEPCHYIYVDVENPPGMTCFGLAMNNLGQVVGVVNPTADYHRAFLWSPEAGTTLLPLPPGVLDMEAYGINDQGHVVGEMQAQNQGRMAFLWDGQQYTILSRPPWANWSEANSINSHDQIAGFFSDTTIGPTHAFSWDDGKFIDLGFFFESDSIAEAINEFGDVAGHAYVGEFDHAYVVQEGVPTWLAEPSGMASSQAVALNNNGFVVGYGRVPSDPQGTRGVIWGPQGVRVLQGPPSNGNVRWDP